jgi:flavin reductase (DIM6/NTAB) family NADH-FMN oxidoreductase RutF
VSRPLTRGQFLSIMSAFPSGVAIVTTIDEHGEPRGLTTTAFSSASADPPLVTVCVDRTSRTLPALLHTRRFVVNLMSSGHDAVCAAFAAKSADKFAAIDWSTTDGGLPVLDEGAAAWAECALDRDIVLGDHVLLVGRVERGREPRDECEPLVYFRRTYGRFHPHEVVPAAGRPLR